MFNCELLLFNIIDDVKYNILAATTKLPERHYKQ